MRLMWLSDSALISTGFANQSKLVCQMMHDRKHEVIYVGKNYFCQPIRKVFLDDGMQELPYLNLPGDPKEAHCGPKLLKEYIAEYKPDKIGFLVDTFMMKNGANPTWLNEVNLPESYFWYPSDGGWFPLTCEDVLRRVNHPVSMSKFGQAQVKEQFGIKAGYIPHGIKTQDFYPLTPEMKEELKKKYENEFYAFTSAGYQRCPARLRNKFVIGCVQRNQIRKMPDRLIKAFCAFAKGKDDVMLLMHSDPFDVMAPVDLQNVASRFGQAHKIWWTGMKWYHGWAQSKMNDLYNLFDVHFLSTSGEGFGIPIVEAMSCAIPNIVTDYTTTKELVTDNKSGIAVPLVGDDVSPYPAEQMLDGTLVGSYNVERGVMSIKKGAEALECLYAEWKQGTNTLAQYGKNGRKAAVEQYDFDTVVGPQWQKLIE